MNLKEKILKVRDSYDPAWRASADVLKEMGEILNTFNLEGILELGPGLSSVLFYEYVYWIPGAKYVAIDHVGEYATKHIKTMESIGVDASNILVKDIDERDGFYTLSDSDKENVKNQLGGKADLFFIDGPVEPSARCCDRALDFLFPLAHPESIWVVDDTNRDEESKLLRLIEQHFHNMSYMELEIPDSTFSNRKSTLLIPMEYT